MARATDDDNTLPPGFSYMTPPPGWPPLPSAEELREMAQRLQKALERRDKPAAPEATRDREAVKDAIVRELHEVALMTTLGARSQQSGAR
jgi:hypothetical protein